MSPLVLLASTGVAFVVTVAAGRSLLSRDSLLYVEDVPNERSLHTSPVPRTGGIAILVGIAAGAAISLAAGVNLRPLAWLGPTFLLVGVVSLVDDFRSLAPFYRLLVHFVAAGLLAFGGFTAERVVVAGVTWSPPPVASFVLSVLFIVWCINLYNFMDGIDGLAGGMAVVGFGSYAWMGWVAGAPSFAAVSLLLAATAAGFLVFNFPPARIFMGDVGSSVLGLAVGALTLWASRSGVFPMWIGVLVFSPFIVDATVTLARRTLRGERVWRAHRSHYYQRVVQMGWGHRKTVLFEYFLMVTASSTAIAMSRAVPRAQVAAALAWVVLYATLAVAVHRWEAARRVQAASVDSR